MVEYTHPHRKEVNLVLEYCDGGDLREELRWHIRRKILFDEGFIWKLLHDIGSALAFLHQGIRDADDEKYSIPGWNVMVHLDLKPRNIFLSWKGSDDGYPRLVLGDFGCTVTCADVSSGRESMTEHIHGTDGWEAPDSFEDVVGEGNVAVGRPTDIWQLGAMAACLCRLLTRPDQEQMFRDSRSHCGSRYSGRLNDVVGLCLRVNRHERPRAIDLVHSANTRRPVKLPRYMRR